VLPDSAPQLAEESNETEDNRHNRDDPGHRIVDEKQDAHTKKDVQAVAGRPHGFGAPPDGGGDVGDNCSQVFPGSWCSKAPGTDGSGGFA